MGQSSFAVKTKASDIFSWRPQINKSVKSCQSNDYVLQQKLFPDISKDKEVEKGQFLGCCRILHGFGGKPQSPRATSYLVF